MLSSYQEKDIKMNIQSLADSSLLYLNKSNTNLINSMNKVSTGKAVNQASDSPSDYYSIKMLEKEVKLNEVAAKTYEREMNTANTESTRLDSAASLAEEISLLASASKDDTLSQEEKDALQMQMDQTTKELDNVLKTNKLGSAESLGLTDLKINSSTADSEKVASAADSAFKNLLTQNESAGTRINSLSRKTGDLQQSLVDTRASLSTLQDADLASEATKIEGYKSIQSLALNGVQKAQAVSKSVLNLFG